MEGFSVVGCGKRKRDHGSDTKGQAAAIIADLILKTWRGSLCRTLKDDPALRDIIIIILSSSTDLETKLACIASGANEFLSKPMKFGN